MAGKFKQVIFKITSLQKNLASSFEGTNADSFGSLMGKPLPAALHTGLPAVDFEHAQLLSCISSVRQLCLRCRDFDTCAGCDVSQRNTCESTLISMLGDLLAFVLDHFHTEEKAMRESLLYMLDRHVCEAHIEDHAHISEKIQQIVAALNPMHTVVLVRELDILLERWMSHHVVLHDQALARWMACQNLQIMPGKA